MSINSTSLYCLACVIHWIQTLSYIKKSSRNHETSSYRVFMFSVIWSSLMDTLYRTLCTLKLLLTSASFLTSTILLILLYVYIIINKLEVCSSSFQKSCTAGPICCVPKKLLAKITKPRDGILAIFFWTKNKGLAEKKTI